ncbi:MAG: MMPL family transporter [Solirubrobacteraceae bacterium]
MRSLAKWCFAHRTIVVLTWLGMLASVNVIYAGAGSAYNDNFKLPHTESFDAIRLLQRNAPKASGDTEQIVIAVARGRVTDPGARTRVDALLARVAAAPHVSIVSSPFAPGGAGQIAPSGRVAFANVTFDVPSNKVSAAAAKRLVSMVTSTTGGEVQFELEGQIAAEGEAGGGTSGVALGFLAAGVVLFVAFGSLLAMLLPLLTAGVSLGTGIAIVGVLSHVIDMNSFSGQLALLIGLGVGVDYALFIVTRYRQGLLRGLTNEQAVIESLDTSGRAVMFAGIIVCIAMLGMFALGVSFLYGVAVAAAITVWFTMLAALTLTPALLGFFGTLVLRRRERRSLREHRLPDSDESTRWARWAGSLQRRPAAFAMVGAGAMVLIAIPFFSMRLGSADAGSDPASSTTRKGYDLIARGFGPGYNGPLRLVAQVRNHADQADFVRVERAVAQTPGVVGAGPMRLLPGVSGRPDVAVADVYPRDSPQDVSTAALLHQVRRRVIPTASRGSDLRVLVGGNTAIFDDFSRVLARKLPLFVGVVVLLSFLLLMTVFRSIAIPLTAAVMNLLSVGAGLGVVTAVFQDGWGASLLGVDKTGPIEPFLPVLLFPILFGLSMDYEVLLVSRIYEEWQRRRDTRAAVAHGLAATGRTITAAAAIMILVFGSFVLGGIRVIELFGIGLAGSVLLDAVVIRSAVVPALMLILGDANWRLPRRLARWLPHPRIESTAIEADKTRRARPPQAPPRSAGAGAHNTLTAAKRTIP